MAKPFSVWTTTPVLIDGFAITADNTSDLARVPTHIYVGFSGDLNADLVGGGNVLLKSVPIGIYPLAVQRLYVSASTVSSVIGLVAG